ncbi:hypothetical protein K2X96_03125 [Patescibacteria group bacterium]|nr:hypothetical protein [Patescibacteria group bacterium]
MTILGTGNVGIGTTSPSQKLSVVGNIKSTGSIDADVQFLGQAADTVSAPSFSWTGDTNVGIYRPATDVIGFTTSGAERMRITSTGPSIASGAGNGIGFWGGAPTTYGILMSNSASYQYGDVTDYYLANIMSSGTGRGFVWSYGTVPSMALNANSGNLAIKGALTVNDTAATSTFAGGVAFETSGFVYNYSSNRVGIGTASPSASLQISGDFNIRRFGSQLYPWNLVNDSEGLYSYADDSHVWFIAEQNENAGIRGGFNFVMDNDGTQAPNFNIYNKSATSSPLFQVASNGTVSMGTLSVTGNTTLTQATSTQFFATTASSTNLFATSAAFGGTLSVTGAAVVGSLIPSNVTADTLMFANGFKQLASVTLGTGFTLTSGTLTYASSSVNANLLDGLDSTDFLRSNASDSYTSGTLTFDAATALDLNTTSLSIADTDIAFDGASTNFNATGNFSINTDDLFINKSTGNVGIGTTTPASILSVSSSFPEITINDTRNITFAVGDVMSSLNFTSSDGSNSLAGTTRGSMSLIAESTTGSANGLSLSTRNVGTFAEAMRITATGNVGLGSSTPSGKLTVVSGGALTKLMVVENSSGVERLTMLDSGRMGISSTTPNHWLSITGNNSAAPLAVTDAAFSTLGLFEVTGGGGVVELQVKNTQMSWFFGQSASEDFTIRDNTNTLLTLQDGAPANSLTLTSAGNFGIGTTSPSQKLSVAGTIKASGSIDTDVQFLGQPADTIEAPSFSWTGDTNVGIYRPATDTIGFTTAGVQRMTINATGVVNVAGLTASRLVATDASKNLVSTITLSNLISSISDVSGSTGTTNLVLSASPTFTGTAIFAGATFTGATTTNLAVTSLTASRVPYTTTGGALVTNSALTYDGTLLSSLVDGSDSFRAGRSSTQNITIFGNSGGNNLTSYSAAAAAKTLVIDSTTDAANTVPSGGTNGISLRIRGVSALAIDDSRNTSLSGTLTANAATFAGNVGIGTTTPSNMLTIIANGSAAGTNEQLTLGSSFEPITLGELVGGITFDSNDNNDGLTGTTVALIQAIAAQAHSTGGYGTNLVFSTTPSNTIVPVEALRIQQSGNIGVGTSTPTAKFVVAGTTQIQGAGATPSYPSNGQGLEIVFDTDASAGSASGGSGGTVMQSYSRESAVWRDLWVRGNNIQFDANGTGAMYIATSGNIGIGSSTPSSLLTVGGDAYIGGNSTTTGTVALLGTSAGSGTSLCLSASNTLVTCSGGVATAAGSGGQLQFNDGSNVMAADADLFWDNTNKRLAVGTTTPAAKFSVTSNNIGALATNESGIMLQNGTAAAAGAQQVSPSIVWEGQGWKTTATAASQSVRFRAHVLPVQGTTAPSATWTLGYSVNGGAYTTPATISSAGLLTLTGGITSAGAFSTSATTNSNLYVVGANTSVNSAVAQYIFGGAAGVNVRTAFYGNSSTAVTANSNYASVLVGSAILTEGTSGNHKMLANLAVKGLGTITAGTATVQDTASLYIDGAHSGATITGLNYALYASSTAPSYFGGTVGIGTTTPISTLSIQGSLCVRDTGSCGTTAGTIYATTAAVTDIDLAENYRVVDPTIKAAEIVSLDTSTTSAIKRAEKGETLLGIISTAPGLLLGQDIKGGKPVALKGRVPLMVNMEGGEIKAGDPITLSSVPGVGTKATTTTQIVGLALDSIDQDGLLEVFVENRMYMSETRYAALNDFFAFGEMPTSTDMSRFLTEGSFMSGFFSQMFAQVTTWLANAGNGIGSVFAGSFHAKDEICVDDQCLTRDDISALLQQVQNSPVGGGQAPAPAPAPEPSPEPTPEEGGGETPEPEPEPSPAPAPEEGGGEAPAPEPEPEPTPEPEPAPAPVPEE